MRLFTDCRSGLRLSFQTLGFSPLAREISFLTNGVQSLLQRIFLRWMYVHLEEDVDGSFIPSRQSAHFHVNNTFGGGYVEYVYINGASNSWSRSGVGVDEPIASYLKGAAVRCLKDPE